MKQLALDEPSSDTESAQDAHHPHGAEEMKRAREITQEKANRDQVEKYAEGARNSVVRSSLFTIHITDRDLDDRSPVPGSQGRNKPMQFAVEWNLFQYLAAVCLEGGAEVVDIHAAQFRHHPVCNAGRNSAQPQVVDALFAPATDDVVALVDLFNEHRDIGGIVLQIAIHGDDVLSTRVVKTGGQPRRLAKVPAQLHNGHTAVDRGDFTQQLKRAIDRAVVHQHDLEALAVSLHHDLQAVVEVSDVFLFVMQGYHDGILWHGSFYYTGKWADIRSFAADLNALGHQLGNQFQNGAPRLLGRSWIRACVIALYNPGPSG